MKGAGKRNEGRSGQHRIEVMLQPVSKTEKDNVNMPAAVTHLYQGGSLKKTELVSDCSIPLTLDLLFLLFCLDIF